MFAGNHIKEDYWTTFTTSEADVDFIYNILLEKETPLTTEALVKSLVTNRIKIEKENSKNDTNDGQSIYLPKSNYKVGDKLAFPSLDMKSGQVTNVSEGFNPDYVGLKVIEVEFESGDSKNFASNIENHVLNHVLDVPDDDPNYDPVQVYENHKEALHETLEATLAQNDDLVKIASSWFPRSLLVDVHIGHLNLAEAILEEANGGPFDTIHLMEQVELNANANKKLLAFSFDLALQEDERFDEVGPTGKVLWFLHAMEPDPVKNVPVYLKYNGEIIDDISLKGHLELFEDTIYDELESWDSQGEKNNRIVISLSYPHWRSGTLPLSKTLAKMFPTAYEAPRVKFTFVDEKEKNKFSGWVVRKHNYVFGLKQWYENNDLMPGSLVIVEKGENPGEIKIQFAKSRQNKEWIKTVLIGSDQAVVFAMLKQSISADYNERMAMVVSDTAALDEIWDKKIYIKEPIEKTIMRILRELSKLNPQGQVHAQELYAAMNIVRRCPPSIVVHHLLENQDVEYLGDLYFRVRDKES